MCPFYHQNITDFSSLSLLKAIFLNYYLYGKNKLFHFIQKVNVMAFHDLSYSCCQILLEIIFSRNS